MNLPLNIFHNGKQVRDIIYAQDVARAFHAFYEKRAPGVYNIGGGLKHAISLIECIHMLEDMLGRKTDTRFCGERFGDLYYFVCNITKATTELAWSPAVAPREGVGLLVHWLQENAELFTPSS
jgi:CDP-paratose 2-epimerase